MKRNGGTSAVGMPELLVGTALSHFLESQPHQDIDNLAWLENWYVAHSRDKDGLNTDKLAFVRWLTILEKHLDDFSQISV
jgi:hypothetical protein